MDRLEALSGENRRTPDDAKGADRLRQLDYFVGFWDCDGVAEASHLGHGHSIRSTFEMQRALGDRWYRLQCVEMATVENPAPITVTNHWGYDAARDCLVRTFHASTGAWGTASSAGFVDGTLVWDGEITQSNGVRLRFRQIVTKTGANSLDEAMDVELDGAWVRRGSLRCRRRID